MRILMAAGLMIAAAGCRVDAKRTGPRNLPRPAPPVDPSLTIDGQQREARLRYAQPFQTDLKPETLSEVYGPTGR